MNRIVVIMPTKDRHSLLERAVESICSQVGDWRAVVVNDGSCDNTHEYLDRLAASDSRFRILHNETNRGVNFSRNRALAELAEEEWGFLLDDDDLLLPGAIEQMVSRIKTLPAHIEYIFFNTRIRTSRETFSGGYQFGASTDAHVDPSYYDVFTKAGLRGDCKPALSWSLVAKKYRFAEDVNGFESEFNALVARDGIGIRYCRDEVVLVDQSHDQERLSNTAMVRDPASFVRVHVRMLKGHAALLRQYPALLRARAKAGIKIAFRAHDVRAVILFALFWLKSFFRPKEQYKTESDIKEI